MRRPCIDEPFVRTPLARPLDVEPRESNHASIWQTLVFFSERRKPHRRKHPTHLIPQFACVVAGACNHDH